MSISEQVGPTLIPTAEYALNLIRIVSLFFIFFKKFLAQSMQVQKRIQERMADNGGAITNLSNAAIKTNVTLEPNFDILLVSKESFRNYLLRFENSTRMKNMHTNESCCANLLLNSICGQELWKHATNLVIWNTKNK